MDNPVKSEFSNTSSSSALNCSTTSSKPILSRSCDLSNPAGPLATPEYIMQEAVMERKATSLGIRREFFKYLQSKRDEVRAQHPNCSRQYRHFAADSLVWARFFRKDPFPCGPPQGLGLHLPPCSMSASGSKPHLSSERLSISKARSGSSQPLSSSERLTTSRAFKGSSQSLTSAERLRLPDKTSGQAYEPRELIIELKRRKRSRPFSQDTRAVMANKHITWTTMNTAKRVSKSFTATERYLMDAIKNEFKCHFRSYETSSGDLILWNEAFSAGDTPAFNRASKFLNGWLELAWKVESPSFSNYWRHFRESAMTEPSSTHPGSLPLILVNQKVFKCSITQSRELLQLFNKDGLGLSALENSLGCKFSYCHRFPDRIIDFRAITTPSTNRDSSEAVKKRLNHFLECWVDKLLAHDRVDPNSSPSKYYWNQYHQENEREDRFNGQIIIHGDKYGENPSKVIVACQASSLSRISTGLRPENDIVTLRHARHDLNFQIRELQTPSSEDLQTLEINITPIRGNGVDDVDTSCMVMQNWVVKALRDPSYSLLAHLKQQIQVKQSVVTGPQPNRLSSASNSDSGWERYAITFKASELDRLMIEEAAKAEGSLRMVLDEASKQVIGLEEYGKRIIGRAADRSMHLNDREPSRSSVCNDSEGGAGKRKLNEGAVKEGQAEKKARV